MPFCAQKEQLDAMYGGALSGATSMLHEVSEKKNKKHKITSQVI
jgi:hypothetical protein